MELWNDLTVGAYGLTIFMLALIIPIMFLLFAIRLIGRSTRKTINTFKKK